MEGAESEANTQTRHANDDDYQLTATKIYLIQNISYISICHINGKQFFSFAVNINRDDITYLDLRRGRFIGVSENMFGDYVMREGVAWERSENVYGKPSTEWNASWRMKVGIK